MIRSIRVLLILLVLCAAIGHISAQSDDNSLVKPQSIDPASPQPPVPRVTSSRRNKVAEPPVSLQENSITPPTSASTLDDEVEDTPDTAKSDQSLNLNLGQKKKYPKPTIQSSKSQPEQQSPPLLNKQSAEDGSDQTTDPTNQSTPKRLSYDKAPLQSVKPVVASPATQRGAAQDDDAESDEADSAPSSVKSSTKNSDKTAPFSDADKTATTQKSKSGRTITIDQQVHVGAAAEAAKQSKDDSDSLNRDSPADASKGSTDSKTDSKQPPVRNPSSDRSEQFAPRVTEVERQRKAREAAAARSQTGNEPLSPKRSAESIQAGISENDDDDDASTDEVSKSTKNEPVDGPSSSPSSSTNNKPTKRSSLPSPESPAASVPTSDEIKDGEEQKSLVDGGSNEKVSKKASQSSSSSTEASEPSPQTEDSEPKPADGKITSPYNGTITPKQDEPVIAPKKGTITSGNKGDVGGVSKQTSGEASDNEEDVDGESTDSDEPAPEGALKHSDKQGEAVATSGKQKPGLFNPAPTDTEMEGVKASKASAAKTEQPVVIAAKATDAVDNVESEHSEDVKKSASPANPPTSSADPSDPVAKPDSNEPPSKPVEISSGETTDPFAEHPTQTPVAADVKPAEDTEKQDDYADQPNMNNVPKPSLEKQDDFQVEDTPETYDSNEDDKPSEDSIPKETPSERTPPTRDSQFSLMSWLMSHFLFTVVLLASCVGSLVYYVHFRASNGSTAGFMPVGSTDDDLERGHAGETTLGQSDSSMPSFSSLTGSKSGNSYGDIEQPTNQSSNGASTEEQYKLALLKHSDASPQGAHALVEAVLSKLGIPSYGQTNFTNKLKDNYLNQISQLNELDTADWKRLGFPLVIEEAIRQALDDRKQVMSGQDMNGTTKPKSQGLSLKAPTKPPGKSTSPVAKKSKPAVVAAELSSEEEGGEEGWMEDF